MESLGTGYALAAPKKQASGIVEALESARYRAKLTGRSDLTFDDIKGAVTIDHLGASAPAGSGPLQEVCNRDAPAVKSPRGDAVNLPAVASHWTDSTFPIHGRFNGARLVQPIEAKT